MHNKNQSLSQKTIKGILWNILGQAGHQILQIVFTVILARLLAPDIFGLVAMVTIFTGYGNVLINFGFGSAMIQKKDLTELDRSSIFWATMVLGLIVCFITIGLAPYISELYNDKRLYAITIIISFTFVFASANVVQDALFTRELDFKSITIRRVGAIFIAGCIAIFLAYQGYGYWSLVFQQVASVFFTTVFIWIISPWRPKFIFSWQSIKNVGRLSSSLFFNSSLAYFVNNLDSFLVGKYFGEKNLGLYNKSFSLISLPTRNVSTVLSRVFLPAFSKIQDDKVKVGQHYLLLTKSVALITLPFMLLIFQLAEPLIVLLFGIEWIGAVPFFKVFSISGIIASVNTLLGSVIISQGRSDLIFREVYLKRPSILLGILVGSMWGVIGIAIGKLIADFFNLGVSAVQIRSALDISVIRQIKNLLNLILASIIALSFSFLFFDIGQNIELETFLLIVIFLIVYALLVFVLEKRDLSAIIKIVRRAK